MISDTCSLFRQLFIGDFFPNQFYASSFSILSYEFERLRSGHRSLAIRNNHLESNRIWVAFYCFRTTILNGQKVYLEIANEFFEDIVIKWTAIEAFGLKKKHFVQSPMSNDQTHSKLNPSVCQCYTHSILRSQ